MRDEPLILTVGEVLWDCFGRDRRLGGAPFNFAYYAGALGADAVMVSAVGRDRLGRDLRRAAAEVGFSIPGRRRTATSALAGCSILHLQSDRTHPTGAVRVRLDPAGNPTFRILRRRAWDFIQYASRLGRLATEADLVCFGTLAQRSPRSRATIRRLVGETTGVRFCDLNLRPPFVTAEVVRYSLATADVLKLNEAEFKVVRRMFRLPSGRLRAARRLMRDFAIDLVCVTRGARGAWVTARREAVSVAGERVTVADTVGAGDAFAASLAVDYLAGRDLGTIARNANHLGAVVASQPGAIGPVTPRTGLDLSSGR